MSRTKTEVRHQMNPSFPLCSLGENVMKRDAIIDTYPTGFDGISRIFNKRSVHTWSVVIGVWYFACRDKQHIKLRSVLWLENTEAHKALKCFAAKDVSQRHFFQN